MIHEVDRSEIYEVDIRNATRIVDAIRMPAFERETLLRIIRVAATQTEERNENED
jgi:hypothetical protein